MINENEEPDLAITIDCSNKNDVETAVVVDNNTVHKLKLFISKQNDKLLAYRFMSLYICVALWIVIRLYYFHTVFETNIDYKFQFDLAITVFPCRLQSPYAPPSQYEFLMCITKTDYETVPILATGLPWYSGVSKETEEICNEFLWRYLKNRIYDKFTGCFFMVVFCIFSLPRRDKHLISTIGFLYLFVIACVIGILTNDTLTEQNMKQVFNTIPACYLPVA